MLNNLPLVFLIAVFGILHVANNHRIEKKIREINSLEKELKQLRWMYMTSKSELMFKSKQSEVAKMVEELGLEESVKAPYKIEVKEDTIYSINLLEYNDLKDSLSQLITNDSLPLLISFANGELVGAIPDIGNYQIDSLGNFTLKTEEEIPLFSQQLSVISKYQNGEILYDLSFGGGEEVVEETNDNFLAFREHPYPKDLSQLFPESPPVWYSYFQQYKIWIKSILIFLLFL